MTGSAHSMPARSGGHRGILLGSSAGGAHALRAVLGELPAQFPLPLLLAQHLHRSDGGRFAAHLQSRLRLRVTEAEDKQPLAAGWLHVAPANYHLLVERGGTSVALSVDHRVNWARPSVDVLLESAALAWGPGAVAVILSGANHDGARGLAQIARSGGLCLVQDPATAEHPEMPRSALQHVPTAEVLALGQLARRLGELAAPAEGPPPAGVEQEVTP